LDVQGNVRPGWHRHRFNTDRSWRLILAIVPRVPKWLRPALHFGATLVFFLVMGNERRAAQRNMRRVTGKRGAAGLLLTFRLFYNFSRFLVAYIDLPPYAGVAPPDAAGSLSARGGGDIAARVEGRDEATGILRSALAKGRGVILAGMHLGQWDMALILFARMGVPVTVVMRKEDEEAARHAAAARAAAGIRIVHALESPWLGVELLAALRRNEIVALQADRPHGDRTTPVSFFGAETEIPSGPWDLARASGAPVFPGVLVMETAGRFRLICAEPIVAASKGMEPLVASMESLIAAHPDQWFNFYDIWPNEKRSALAGSAAHPAESARAAMIGSRRA